MKDFIYEMKYLKGFDYANYLKRIQLVGQLDPWRYTEDGKPLYTTLAPMEVVLAECSSWSGQEISKTEFISYLKLNDIIPFKNIEEFQKVRDNLRTEEKLIKKIKKEAKVKKSFTPEQKEALRQRMVKINENKKPVVEGEAKPSIC